MGAVRSLEGAWSVTRPALLLVLTAAATSLPWYVYSRAAPGRSDVAGCWAVDGDTLRCSGTADIDLLGVSAGDFGKNCRAAPDCGGDGQQRALERFIKVGGIGFQLLAVSQSGHLVAIVRNADGELANCAAIRAGAQYSAPVWEVQQVCGIDAVAAAGS